MPATKFGLPISITTDLLSQVLRYEPRHWKALQHRLTREHSAVWKDVNLSDKDFYAKLHALLKTPVNRQAFEGAAQKEGTRNRPLTLFGELRKHYSKSLRSDPSLAKQIPKRAKPREFLDVLAAGDDDDRLANVVWTFAENGQLGPDELSRIAIDYPGIRSRLAGSVKGIHSEATPLMAKWTACISQMRDALDVAVDQGPNSDVVDLLAGHVDELRELAEESVRFASVWKSLVDLVEEHGDVLSDHDALKPYARVVAEVRPCGESPQDAEELLEKIDEQLRTLARTAGDQRKASAAMAEANAEHRNRLIQKIIDLRETEAHIRSDTEWLLGELFDGLQLDVEPETPEASTAAAGSQALTDGTEIDPSVFATENLDASVSGHVGDNAQVPSQELDDGVASYRRAAIKDRTGDTLSETGEKLDSAGGSTEPADKAREELAVSPNPVSTEPARAVCSPPTEPPISLAVAISHDGIREAPPEGVTAKDDEAKAEVTTDVLVHEAVPATESAAFEAMLRAGRFARAYWLTCADRSIGDPNLLGALAEGVSIGPGSACPGELTHFLDALASKNLWNDDERLLLCGAVLGPCLYLDPLPQGIYPLASHFPVDGSPVGPLMQRLRELCVYQNATIRPDNLGVESADSARGARLDDLANDARGFLARVPHIRFAYQPADRALQFLYRAGSEWYRLHTIVGENRSKHLKEVSALTKGLDAATVIASLHLESELVALKQPLEGIARDKLARHLHHTLSLAREWAHLTDVSRGGSTGTSEKRGEELRREFQTLLKRARTAFEPIGGRGPVDAIVGVLEDVDAQLEGRRARKRESLFADLLLLAGLPLEDDFEPADRHVGALRIAILNAEGSEPEPEAVFDECLGRQEFRRARTIIDRYRLDPGARDRYEQAVAAKRSELDRWLKELEIEIEDAFLLGQLRDDAVVFSSPGDANHNSLERSRLLGVVREGKDKLHRSGDTEADGLREMTFDVEKISRELREMTSSRRERLVGEVQHVLDQLPDTEQGQADRAYLREALDECMESNDHVAAFDLLDRGRRAAQGIEPVARASLGRSESLERFLRRADGYREALTGRGGLARIESSIRGGDTVAGIAFGQLDRTRRDEAAVSLGAWHSLTGLRLPAAHDELRGLMDRLLRFVGLPVANAGVDVRDTTEAGFAHIRATFTRPISSSPLPAFGSVCRDRFEIVVSQSRKEPQQVEEYIRGRKLADQPVLVFLLPPESPDYRLRWHRHCVRSRLTALPFDFAMFLHLCGVRNRLLMLLEIGLPFTWSCPYITKGENVAAEMFVGRSDEAAALRTPTGSCVVFGGRQLGKSALLRHVHRETHDPSMWTYIAYLDVDDLGIDSQDHDVMVTAFWRRIYDELHREGAIPDQPRRILDRERRLADEIPRSVMAQLATNEEMRIVLLLDESDNLLDCDSHRNFALVRQLRDLMARTERRFKVVFAGLQSVQRYNNWKNHPFAQLGSELVVNPLPPAAAQDLIIRPFRALGFAFDRAGLILRILSQTNYHPGLIQIFCYRLLENLYEKVLRTAHEGPIRRITDDDILGVERDAAVMEDIRNRFDWTLDLDDRYKVLTYALVLTPEPAASRFESEFMAIGASWWPTVFEAMDSQSLRAVLDEMVGLGVLLKEHDYDDGGRRRYRLRSPNLLRLLGPQEAIESELWRIITRDRISRSNPRNFHPVIDKKPVTFGPLTNEQQGQISAYSRPFQMTVISGSDALGLSQVEQQIDWLLSRSKDDGNRWSPVSLNDGSRWKRISHVGRDIDTLVAELQKAFRRRSRVHRYAVIRADEMEFEGSFSALFDRFIGDLGQLCTNKSRGHVAILLGPSETWHWLVDEHRERIVAQPRVTGLALRRWSDGAIANAFDQLEARTGSKSAAVAVFERTSGFHKLVDEGLRRASPRQGTNVEELVGVWDELRGEVFEEEGGEAALEELGLRGAGEALEACVCEILRLTEPHEGESVLVETSFDLAAEALSGDSHTLLEEKGAHLREWMRAMGLTTRSGGVHDDGSMIVPTWVQGVLKAAGG